MQDQLPHRALVLDLKNLIYIDSSGADTLLALARACHKKQVRLIVCGLCHQPLDMAQRSGLLEQLKEHLQPDLSSSIALAVSLSAEPAR
jgi:SulP family sulfate permease